MPASCPACAQRFLPSCARKPSCKADSGRVLCSAAAGLLGIPSETGNVHRRPCNPPPPPPVPPRQRSCTQHGSMGGSVYSPASECAQRGGAAEHAIRKKLECF
eukprot:Tamp_35624.p3 GENE.Tamp_35624~~Tamp_35624.p3  ORF type:complete len:103 (-),score=3.17 Tamp_35624:123-431(-)